MGVAFAHNWISDIGDLEIATGGEVSFHRHAHGVRVAFEGLHDRGEFQLDAQRIGHSNGLIRGSPQVGEDCVISTHQTDRSAHHRGGQRIGRENRQFLPDDLSLVRPELAPDPRRSNVLSDPSDLVGSRAISGKLHGL